MKKIISSQRSHQGRDTDFRLSQNPHITILETSAFCNINLEATTTACQVDCCNKTFDRNALDHWLEISQRQTCPTCRYDLSVQEVESNEDAADNQYEEVIDEGIIQPGQRLCFNAYGKLELFYDNEGTFRWKLITMRPVQVY